MKNGNCDEINDHSICDFDGGDCSFEEWNDYIWNIFNNLDEYDDYMEFCEVGVGNHEISK